MTALELPAPNAPAEEWGRLAVSLPGWRNPRLPWLPYLLSPLGTSSTATRSNVPDPDHWAWEGWLLRLLGRPVELKLYHGVTIRRYPRIGCSLSEGVTGRGSTNGRACIAAAAALGRWPGGEG